MALDMCGAYAELPKLDESVDLWNGPAITYNAASDTYTDTNNCTFRQLFQDYPVLKPLYPFQWENEFNAWALGNFAERYMHVAFLIAAGYLAFLILGQKFMAGREKFQLRGFMQLWNLLLSVFSFFGFIRTAPHLLHSITTRGFYYSVCAPAEPSFGHGAAGFWMMLFVFSKLPELIDTVILVMRKTPVIFLHWFHHATVLLFCWHSYATRSSAGLYFASMNYGVHALMYFYFFLTARGIKPGWNQIVTTLQISQMFVGMFICGAVAYFQFVAEKTCDTRPENLASGSAMYAAYAVLFIFFALEKYITGKSSLENKRRAPKAAAGVEDAKAKKEEAEAAKEGEKQVESKEEDEPSGPASGKAALRKRNRVQA